MTPETEKLATDIMSGKRLALSRSITLIESTLPEHRLQAELLLDSVVAATQEARESKGARQTFRVGISGPPGAGKSTFIESLGLYLLELGLRPAVIAIDPSSVYTGGSILGDKTRMTYLSRDRRAFVRPSPTQGNLGGVAEHTSEVVQLCEAAGFDVVIVETVGLGQSEVEVDAAVDMLLLLVPPAGGDELQGVKKGIMEVADMVVVNKADGDLIPAARHAASDFRRALQLMRRKHADWIPPVKRCSALDKQGIDRVWNKAWEFYEQRCESGQLQEKRTTQSIKWMWSQFQHQILRTVTRDERVKGVAASLEEHLKAQRLTSRHAAHLLHEEALDMMNRFRKGQDEQ